jgi:transaldolase
MSEKNYLQWLSSETATRWWHDSGDPAELAQGRAWGAVGVTTNPVLTFRAIADNRGHWENVIKEACGSPSPKQKAERLMSAVVGNAARMFEPVYRDTAGEHGYVCAQLDPALAVNREAMTSMAKRFAAWAPNVSVKFPATTAGLDALEECVAQGICATSTVSFTVPQVIAAAQRHRRAVIRAERAGIKPGRCFAVIMIGRIDDYLREVALDRRADVSEEDLNVAGLAIVKRAYQIFKQNSYEAKLLVAALRGAHHMLGLCGAELVMSIHPKIQALLLAPGLPRSSGIEEPVSKSSIKRLQTIPEFIKAYEPDILHEQDFVTFGVTQKTLSQFSAGGWSLLEAMSH